MRNLAILASLSKDSINSLVGRFKEIGGRKEQKEKAQERNQKREEQGKRSKETKKKEGERDNRGSIAGCLFEVLFCRHVGDA